MKKNRRKNKTALRIAGIVFGHLILFLSVAFCGRMGGGMLCAVRVGR